MMKSKADLMKSMRRKRRLLGLVEFRAWVTPNQKKDLTEYVSKLDDKGDEL